MSLPESKATGTNALDAYCFQNNIPDFTFSTTSTSVSLDEHLLVPLKLQLTLPEINEENLHLAKASLANAVLTYIQGGIFSHLKQKELASCSSLMQEYSVCTSSDLDEVSTWCIEMKDKILGLEFEITEDFMIGTIVLAGVNRCLVYTLQNDEIPTVIKVILQDVNIKKISQDLDLKYVVFERYNLHPAHLIDVSNIAYHVCGFREGTPIDVLSAWCLNLSVTRPTSVLMVGETPLHAILYYRVYDKLLKKFLAENPYIHIKWVMKE